MNHLILFLPIFWLFSCTDTDNSEEFEGVIEYRITIESEDERTNEALKNAFGEKHLYYFKDGNYKTENFLDTTLVMTQVFLAKENINYSENPLQSDIIMLSKVWKSDSEFKLLKEEKKKEEVAGYICDYYEFKIINDTVPWMNYQINYWVSGNIKINKERFKNYKSNCWEQIFNIIGTLPIKYERILVTRRNVPIEVTYELVNIEEKELDMSEFKIDKNKPMREFP